MSITLPIRFIFLLIALQLASTNLSAQKPLDSEKNDIQIKLKWFHQFQFAGFYAADIKGYYKEAGLDVKIIESSASSPPIDFVLNNKNTYGVSSQELIESRAIGKPVVMLSAIFQHSPYVIISLKEKNIKSPKDLIGKKVMASKDQGLIQLRALLNAQNIDLNKLQIVEHTWNNEDLIKGNVDAQTGYVSVEAFQIKQRGYDVNIIRPIDYGVDFYGDILFTSYEEINKNPDRALAVKRATNKGWEYAMTHIDEICDYILNLPGVRNRGITKENLIYEALMMQHLIKSDLVEIGHINRSRINNMINIYKKNNVIDKKAEFNDFIFDEVQHTEDIQSAFKYFWGSIISIVLILLGIFFWNRQLRKRVDEHINKIEQENIGRLKAEQIAKESEERLELALSAARLGIWDSDLLTGYVYRNDIWSEMLGYDKGEIEPNYEGWRKLVHPEDFNRIEPEISAHHKGKSLYNNYEHRLLTKAGEWKWILSLSKTVAVDKEGKATRLIGIHIDIDELKSKELQLQAITDELMHSNAELEKFAYITSHNLRAPVVNIISLIELLDLEKIGDHQNELIINKVQLSVLRLESTLNDLVEVVSAKKQALMQRTNISISSVCDKVIANLESQLTKSNAEIKFNFCSTDTIYFVPGILESIVQNLITNSIKYRNPEKRLVIEIKTTADDHYVHLSIKDNGIGFDSKKLGQKIFKLYERFHHHIEGKGLGLYLIKTQIDSMGGKIEAHSKIMEGAEFIVSIKQ